VWPVRIEAGAFGPNRPTRNLFLSPDHALYTDDVLIPVKHLINGTTIVRTPVDTVTYFHVELPEHAVLLADNLPAESYLDAGDRANFANALGPVALYPDFASRMWDAAGCAPLVVTGGKLDAIRQWGRCHRRHQGATYGALRLTSQTFHDATLGMVQILDGSNVATLSPIVVR
jgi:hypothetical protein